MSDDTPTERFRPDDAPDPRRDENAPRPSDDAPTQAFDPFADEDDGDSGGTRRDDTPTELFRAEPSAPEGDAATRLYPQQPGRPDPIVASHVPVYDGRADAGYDDRQYAAPPRAAAPTAAAARQPTPPASRGAAPPPGKSRAPVVALIIIGTLILVGLIVLALVFATRDNVSVAEASPSPTPTTESPSPTPSEEPTPEPTETEEPAPAPATFVSFSPADGAAITCPDEETEVPLVFSWSSTDAERAWIGVDTTDARENPTDEVDPSGTYRDLTFDCGSQSRVYTVSLENADGELTSETVTLVRELEEE